MAYHPLWAPVLTLELLAQISLLIMGLFALGLFFQKRRIFPYWYIAFMVGNACFLVGDAVSVAVIKPSSSAGAGVSATVFGALLGCCVWIPYMLQSRRVKVTFVK